MLSERLLRKYRQEALQDIDGINKILKISSDSKELWLGRITANERILKLTQELLDQHLLRRAT